ncbi:(4Fe-4S)-binding protein [Ohtaekwangia sp.]|uniref:(4Fe-4S)-binding protein n=1 Tax=Ohtaekwangia sp. TaxID=2066019 RepID=UPI002FDDC55F
MKNITKKYTNGEITIVWNPAQCTHSTLCWKGLGEVLDPRKTSMDHTRQSFH